MEKIKNKNLIIIGGGASGLAAAVSYVQNCKGTVCVLEKNRRVGKKIMLSGNGRCNLSNMVIDKDCYDTDFALKTVYTPDELINWFLNIGLVTRRENQRVYPYSMMASSVLDVLRHNMQKNNVEEICDFDVVEIKQNKDGFVVNNSLSCNTIIYAGGSIATTGKINNPILRLGHSQKPFVPLLCPVKAKVKGLNGQRVRCVVKLYNGKNFVASSNGELQFKDNALGGIVVFEIGFLRHKYGGDRLVIDFMPEYTETDLVPLLQGNNLTGIFARPLSECILAYSTEKNCSVIDAVKHMEFMIGNDVQFEQAQICGGGILVDEINLDFSSKIVDGLYITGEALNVAGQCGGYNLHFAFSSGIKAGESAAKRFNNAIQS